MTFRIAQWLLLLLLTACAATAVFLVYTRPPAHQQLKAPSTSSVPLSKAPGESRRSVTLMMPDDKTGRLTPISLTLALPRDETSRARALIQRLLASWRAPGSPHPVRAPGGASAGVDSVFLLPIPNHPNRRLAVVNLDAAFPRAQPSGIEPETLTLLSIIQTLHANIPSITRVRFLVGGEPRPTLAGHADLMRSYLARTTVSGPKS